MPPLSLLFSSDEEMSHQMVQALNELELEVEPCTDVFAAVESLIGRSFDVIVADCDSGPEASFLLKNARELKLNKAAFTLALTGSSAKLTSEEAGADLVLTKPLDIEQIKYALLGNDRFLASMKAWIARGVTTQSSEATPYDSWPTRHQMPSPALPTMHRSPPSPTRSNRGESGVSSSAPPAKTKATPNRGKFLGGIIVGAAFVAAGYISVEPHSPFQSAFARMSALYRRGLEMTLKPAAAEAEYETRPAPPKLADLSPELPTAARRRTIRVRVVAAHAVPVPTPAPAETQTESGSDQEQSTASDARVHIPESLRTPPLDIALRTVSVKHPVSLLGQMEPVALSEDLARELLLEKVDPSYPEQALKAGLHGAVVLQAWIGKDGSIQDLKLVNGPLLLARAAVDAVKQWRYKPYLRNGVAVEAETYVTVNFTLP